MTHAEVYCGASVTNIGSAVDDTFRPNILVYHSRRVPLPILPISYEFFLAVVVPEGVTLRPISEQLSLAKAATARRRAYPFIGPFGPIVAFEFRRTATVSIYLNPEGDFV
jgi:hypothetical protein